MQLKVLGSSAGGGFPQWNCNCRNCRAVRRADPAVTARTQSSICVSENGSDWVLINASPDILQQVRTTPELCPARAPRDSGIAAVMLIDAQIDHTAGLLLLRERTAPLPLYATEPVWQDLSTRFPIGPMLDHYCGVDHHSIPLEGAPFHVAGLDATSFTAIPLESAAPPYSPHRHAPEPGDNIGLLIRNESTGRQAFYAPGLGRIDARTREAMQGADLLLVDGTFWRDDEMQRLGLSPKSAAEMGHLAQSGPHGMISHLDALASDTCRKVLIHINNTNPILRDDSPERAELARHGIEVAHDGMTFNF
ncbi:pyrroloquinoline quinone biosynthesis protein PqqB [Pandoraea sp.]|uniref:pyrroloquinoline quinone biosynthesis protein PqqB n=1 Tax=Pandoraea sp. TaxID=1883445 RepID=UPI001227CD60|nr:pyrroloquinoline quinone biosynthesis protein PqqB [Pandoraea sp.]MBU6493742.1 pyrroloquinoline quinone biosynthesis protein PqqB [Burkholderiales bacterium]MDE2287056.1 pyrroloquinoline quinone biosynthesis protein PqqB [Burkholderiales bacterium]MDE2611269.1 pyrroloquinoline quinone biosynthesis protein PqqB [Burkholderiales bacterium]TAL55442.1 MAG: pyrroloquinoline quinone biosynthesis protein PqqB [Pandoraea sp.]TAM17327.1 MAG: pyrroloquinoline quinone biosynthesis protein PqqB [Pandor